MKTQEILDWLYALGCEYDIKANDMRMLCTQLGVDYRDLLNHTGPTFKQGKPAPVTLALN